jgi:hypothetical protein
VITPGKRCCDLCKNEIQSGERYCPMSYPLSRGDKQLFHDASPKREGYSVLGDLGSMLGSQVPDAYQFEFCRACIDGILPMLSDLKSEYLKRWFESRDEAKQRAMQEE